jgi:hypothetical protein
VRFRHFLPLALLAGALVGLVSARAPLEKARANLLGVPFTASGGGPSPTVIAFQNAADLGDQGPSSTINWNYSNVTNINTALIVAYLSGGAQSPTAFTYNSVACTAIGNVNPNGPLAAYLYYCPVGSLTPGSHVLNLTLASADTTESACVWEYSGVAQTLALEGAVTGGATTTPTSVSVTTVTDNDWGVGLAQFSFGSVFSTAGGGYTARNNACTNRYGTAYIDTNAVVHPAGVTTPTWNHTGGGFGFGIGVGLKHG